MYIKYSYKYIHQEIFDSRHDKTNIYKYNTPFWFPKLFRTALENPSCQLTASSVLSKIIKLKQLSQKDISNLNFNRETLQENK